MPAWVLREADKLPHVSQPLTYVRDPNGDIRAVPEEALRRRVAQVGNGKIFGGYFFVMAAIFGFGSCFAGHPVPRPVFAGVGRGVSPVEAYASHGWRKAG